MFRYRTLSKYILKELFPPFLLGVSLFLFILMTTRLVKIGEAIIVHGVSPKEAFLLVFYLLASFISIAIPLALLFGSLLVLGRLSADRELVAMRAAGISQTQIIPPFAFIAMIFTVVVLYLTFFVEPWGFKEFRVLAKRIGSDMSSVVVQPRTFNEKFFGLIIYADGVEPKTKKLEGVFLHDERVPEEPLTVFAKHGLLLSDQESQTFTLRLYDGSIHRDPGGSEVGYQRIDFGKYDINLDLASMIKFPRIKPRMLTYAELRQKIDTLPPNSRDYRKHVVEWHRKIALAVSCLAFILLGVALGGHTGRGLRSSAFLVTLGVLLMYYVSYVKMGKLARDGMVPIWFGMWTPNIVILIASIGLFFRNLRR